MNFSKKNHEHKKENRNFVSKNLKVTTTILAMAFIGFEAVAGNENRTVEIPFAMHSNKTIEFNINSLNSNDDVISLYLQLKDDLVAGDGKAAAEISKKLVMAIDKMDISKYDTDQQSEIKKIVAEAKVHADQIAKSEIAKQREHFKLLSNNMIDLVTITGTESTLYQQYCPMYDKGSSWLSKSKDIKNPYYGSKMLACGRVEKEFN